jgi:hypothetical protein
MTWVSTASDENLAILSLVMMRDEARFLPWVVNFDALYSILHKSSL